MQAEPQKEHKWLEQLGEWEIEMEAATGPGQPPAKHTGTDTVRSLTLWVQCDGTGSLPDGGTAKMVMTLRVRPGEEEVRRYVHRVDHDQPLGV